MNISKLKNDLNKALDKLLKEADLKEGDSVLIGGSTSEVIGENLGSATNLEISKALMKIFITKMKNNKLNPIIQSCEHINRALVVEKSYADKYHIMPVNVLPTPSAGGGFSSSAMEILDNPVIIEKGKRIYAGIDIGDVFIGMHLDPDRVGVVVRPEIDSIGYAHLTMIRTREKLIGGSRSKHY